MALSGINVGVGSLKPLHRSILLSVIVSNHWSKKESNSGFMLVVN